MNERAKHQPLTAELLRGLLNYDPTAGVFTWKITFNNRLKPGDVAGSVRPNGYVNLGVAGKLYLAHRLAWMYVYGDWPKSELDHINRNKSDNRIDNLREVTRAQNCHNSEQTARNLSGVKGVYFCLVKCKWCARLHRKGKSKHLGYFMDINEAAKAYRLAVEAHELATPQSSD